ncbi:hypothetical protein IEQ34_003742 [Dendrobium chrysotoxum]|uniref:Uncharacterized protein n=1 Tax=Dendrobium chrysotoxum TaxID=161865 RepID=A0AAV7HFA8_DENCH|nr:hypothetical protein IEQ34_003742 [Dendrobium chrysotoxum]
MHPSEQWHTWQECCWTCWTGWRKSLSHLPAHIHYWQHLAQLWCQCNHSGSNGVATPLIVNSLENFYFFSLENISVAKKTVIVGKPNASNQANITIYSGTTLTLIDDNTL